MNAPFLDTNVILRHLLGDHDVASPACLRLVQAIERGELTVWTSDLVIAEAVFTLSSKALFNRDRVTVRDLLLPLINLRGIRLPHKRLYRRVFEFYTSTSMDYVDAFHAAQIERQGNGEVLSYDRHFDGIAGVRRREP